MMHSIVWLVQMPCVGSYFFNVKGLSELLFSMKCTVVSDELTVTFFAKFNLVLARCTGGCALAPWPKQLLLLRLVFNIFLCKDHAEA